MWIVIALLSTFLAWGGEKPAPDPDNPDPPTPPVEPDEPEPPLPPLPEGTRIKLIGRYSDGKFIPLTSEWIDSTNLVETIERIKNEE